MNIQELINSLTVTQVIAMNRLLGFRTHDLVLNVLYDPQDLRENLIQWFKHHTSLYEVAE